nr:MAG TPA: hypothetical protein [Caudoviricetes sp.]
MKFSGLLQKFSLLLWRPGASRTGLIQRNTVRK